MGLPQEEDGRPGRTTAEQANIVQHLNVWQAPSKVAEIWQPKAEIERFLVHEKNWPAVSLFIAMETQWRVVAVSGLGGVELLHQGLDYAALSVVAAAHDAKLDEPVLRNLRIMEGEALRALGEARERRAKARSTKAKAQKRKKR